jgi:hypothetical protein
MRRSRDRRLFRWTWNIQSHTQVDAKRETNNDCGNILTKIKDKKVFNNLDDERQRQHDEPQTHPHYHNHSNIKTTLQVFLLVNTR